MKTTLILLALAVGVSTLIGCSSDAGSANTPAPTPQDSGPVEKTKGKQEKVGGRVIPGAKQ